MSCGTYSRFAEFERDPVRMGIKELSLVHGIGTSLARQYVAKGISSVEMLKAAVANGLVQLPEITKIGLKHVDAINIKMPRAEIEEIARIVKVAVNKLYPGSDADLMGSYRRGNESSYDADLLITNETFHDAPPSFGVAKLVTLLREEGFILDDLTLPKANKPSTKSRVAVKSGQSEEFYKPAEMFDKPAGEEDEETLEGMNVNHSSQMYMGICIVPTMGNIARRIDIKWYPREQKAFAEIYFTGNSHFNRSMRLYAKVLGFSLSDHGLHKSARTKIDGKTVVLAKGKSLVAETEADVFKLLGLEFRGHLERNCYDAVASAKMDGLDFDEEDDDEQVVDGVAIVQSGWKGGGARDGGTTHPQGLVPPKQNDDFGNESDGRFSP